MAANIAWELYRSFLAVLQQGSLSGAARALGIAQPTVGRHVASLEKALRLALFTRSQAGFMPTGAALTLRVHAEEMASTAAALERAAARHGEGVRGVVRVTASEIVAVEVLPPALAELHERYPDLKIELVPSNQVQNVLQREADIAVRMGRPRQEHLIAKHVGDVEIGLYASRGYIERHGRPGSVAELTAHALVGFDVASPFVRSAAKAFPAFNREAFAFRTDNDVAQLALIRAGAGIGVCQVALAKRGEALVRVLPKHVAWRLETWIIMHEDLRNSSPCRATFDALARALAPHARQREAPRSGGIAH
ncbi:MAG TPA: LysR family transcriptional regulator [Usitatibacter sp.]|jgi:DNA-binding transcriptional LysR family regulator|nr:LysR family transcriptional regulator [Usitatibacter sp.]